MIDILSTLCQSSSYYEQNNYKSDVSQKFLLVLFLTIKETFLPFFFFFGGGDLCKKKHFSKCNI